MALGGGTFVTQNKVLPGAYINFVAAAKASAALSERGIATIPNSFDWGEVGNVIEVTTGDLQKNSMKLFGYDYTSPQLRPLRELFANIRIGYLYRLGTDGVAASNAYGAAKYVGTRGNAITIVVKENVDDETKKDVSVLLDSVTVAIQTVSAAANLVDDDFVTYVKTGSLTLTAGTPMTGGTNPVVSNANHQSYLDAIESYTFNAIGCPSNEATVKGLYAAFTRRLRDEQGVKFQCVTFDNAADYEGVVNIMNTVTDSGADVYSLIYWVTGVIAGTNVNKSALNKVYDGEFAVDVNYTQTQLETAIKTGKFAFHRVGDDVRVLSDINSLVTVTVEKGEIFKENQTIRVIDQIANDIAVIFNTRYLGIIPNDEAGRISLWSDIVKHHEQLQEIRAIEGFKSDDVQVAQGNTKRAVVVSDLVTVVNAMAQLYMVVTVA
ncbi:MAG: phage tail sheath family protein [Candidatus Fimivivens sp.]|nr:phage tail sheath family protein [Candidatus Fimivivens sp.]